MWYSIDYFTLPDFDTSGLYPEASNYGDNSGNTFNEDSKKGTSFTDHNPILIPPMMPRVQNNTTATDDLQDRNNQIAIKNSSKNKFSYTNVDRDYDVADSWNDQMLSNNMEAPKFLTEQQKVERRYH